MAQVQHGEASRLPVAVDAEGEGRLAALRQAIAVGDEDLRDSRFTQLETDREIDAFFDGLSSVA